MTAPHLLPIIQALGDGGSAEMAEKVIALYGGFPGAPTVADGPKAGDVESRDGKPGVYEACGNCGADGVVWHETEPVKAECDLAWNHLPGVYDSGDRAVRDGIHGTAEDCAECGDALVFSPDEIQPGPAPEGVTTEPVIVHLAGGVEAEAEYAPSGLDEFAPETTSNPGHVEGVDDPEDDDLDWDDKPFEGVTPKPAPTPSEIREWCLANGVDVAVKGSISKKAMDAYTKAHTA